MYHITFVDPQSPVAVRSPFSQLYIENRALRTVLLWGTLFCSLFVFYLLTLWLPSILTYAGYDIVTPVRIGAMVSASTHPTVAPATGMSSAMGNGRVGSIIGSVLGAWLIAQLGRPSVSFIVRAIPVLFGSIAIFSLQRMTEKKPVPEVTALPTCPHVGAGLPAMAASGAAMNAGASSPASWLLQGGGAR